MNITSISFEHVYDPDFLIRASYYDKQLSFTVVNKDGIIARIYEPTKKELSMGTMFDAVRDTPFGSFTALKMVMDALAFDEQVKRGWICKSGKKKKIK